MFTRLPMVIELTSPLITAENQTEHSSPMTTSPVMVALSARKQSFPNTGLIPLTGNMSAIFPLCGNEDKHCRLILIIFTV
jgi:hypothetical protein